MSSLVSVIIPTYNRARYLARALRSIDAQDYRPIEAIVVDDGSTDNTADLIPEQKASLAGRGIDLTYLKQENAGPARARNAGLSAATGTYIGCLDSDDMWKPSFLSTMIRLLERHPTAGLAFGGYLCIDEDDRLIGQRPSGLPPEPHEGLLPTPFLGVLDYVPFGTPCVMIRRSVIDDVGPFDTAFHVGEDWDMWYRIAKRHDYAYTLEGLTLCRDHTQNMPKQSAAAIADKVRLILKHLPDVLDPAARAQQVRRLRAEMVLLQEQVLRERRQANGLTTLLDHELAPRSMRFKIGSLMLRQPRWLGSAYAKLVRAVGSLTRSAQGSAERQPNPAPSPAK
jgi:glycosyltransferase involved in cell wall biosynthesis